jgi:hypothetical protein
VVAVGLVVLGAALGAGLVLIGIAADAAKHSGAGSTARETAGSLSASVSPSSKPLSPTPIPASISPLASGCPPAWTSCGNTSAIGNFDGSGRKDVMTASAITDQMGKTADWQLQVDLGSGKSVSARLSALVAAQGGCPALFVDYARILGAADFAGPANDLALVEVGHGASTQQTILVGLQDGSLRLVTVADGAERCQRVFPINGSVTHGNGLACGWRDTTAVLWVRQVADHPPDYVDYDWYEATYSWQGLQLHLLSLDHALITSSDPRYAASYRVSCGSINLSA